ncbi:MAG: 4-amino-4-deoxy-L-arabinose transferase [Spirochaetaceae bacterium]|nr:4-amino-4-deoxy-L-arabinose transferase [Spirochaetaceae bacterium]
MSNILLILASVSLNAAAQVLMRAGMLKVGEVGISAQALFKALPAMACNGFLWLSIGCYGVSIITWMVVLSRVEVSFAYPFLSIGYVVSAVVGYFFLGESLAPVRIAGITVICVGVLLIARS